MLNDETEFYELSLGPDDRVGGKWLDEIDLGEEDQHPEPEYRSIRLRIGRQPIAYDLIKLSEMRVQDLDPEIRTVLGTHRPWLLKHVVSVMDEGGFPELLQLGYEMEFISPAKVAVQGLIPNTELVTHGSAEAAVEMNAQVGFTGDVGGLPIGAEPLVFQPGAGLKIGAGGKYGFAISIGLAVKTPVVVANGVGDSRSEWMFRRGRDPLLGDIQMVQTVLVPKNAAKLQFQARVSAVITTFPFVRRRLRSKTWVPLECRLTR